MGSPRLASLKARVADLASVFIAEKDDLDATPEDQTKAIAFRVLASAAIEEYIEERCKEIAIEGIDRLKKGMETSTGRALIVWQVSRGAPGCIPVHPDDVMGFYDQFDIARSAYLASVAANHGASGKDVRNLIHPLGIRAHQMPHELLDRLQALAQKRDPVVHTTAKKASRPLSLAGERKQVEDIVALLGELEDALIIALKTFPVPPP